jgi:1,4-dihydroxy-2-naphthoyl-CoA hydrolase
MIARWSADSWSKVATAAKDSLRSVTEAPLEREEVDLGGMSSLLGFELTEATPELARGTMPVDERVKQPMGIVHGGAYAALAEAVVSHATWLAVRDDGMYPVGMSNETSFLRPVREGMVTAEARSRHRGRTTWVWQVDFTDAEGRLCALSRVTLAVRPIPEGARSDGS